MEIIKKEINKQAMWQIYDYTFLSDILEMLRGTCCFINNYKELSRLFSAVIDYVNSRLPNIDGDIVDISLSVTVKN